MRATAYLMLPAVIRRVVEPGRPGIYILGEFEDGQMVARYIGRSDCCLQTRLLNHNHRYECSYFIFRYASSAKEAFLMECKWWHDFSAKRSELLNKIHPGAPSGQNCPCPYCHFAQGIKAFFSLSTAG